MLIMTPSSNTELVFSPLANAIRALAMDAVQKANSGHPGAPLGMAEIAEALWRGHLKHNPADPLWADRDRFVLSNGHGSMLLYALLHLTGYDLSADDLQNFRQLHSKTPGHPERGYAPGVETTTGPLGQGLANAVGMALAEKVMAATFNRPDHEVIDHRTWVFAGDGCLMEGISHEAMSLAGSWGLGKLTVFYDDNGISIDGHVHEWFGDDTPARAESYGWQVIRDVNGHDTAALHAAIEAAKADTQRPTLICCKTVIGAGSPNKQGTHDVHGAPLGAEEIAATRARLGWNHPPFEIPAEVRAQWDAREQGKAAQAQWEERMQAYRAAHPELAAELERRLRGELPADWAQMAQSWVTETAQKAETIASRKASQNCIAFWTPRVPELLGGSADLAASNLTMCKDSRPVTREADGNYVYYGVREFGMVAIANGVALHGGLVPFTATFLMFSEYARNALRMAALMKVRQICVFTHDSIGLGEDGPTHQPVEQIATLRMIPGMDVWRPCDTLETAVAWNCALARADGPTALCLSRQNLPFQTRDADTQAAVARGGYVLREPAGGEPAVVLIATGSEVALAVQAQETLAGECIAARVVSMPSTTVFDRQDAAWRAAVLPAGVPRVAVEAGSTDFWRKYVGAADDARGAVVGIDRFGESAPAARLFDYFGITADAVVRAAREVVRAKA